MDKVFMGLVTVFVLMGVNDLYNKNKQIEQLKHELEQYKFTAQVLQKQCN